MSINDFKVLSFDCYGTLVDWETGIHNALKPIMEKSAKKISDDEILQMHAKHAIMLEQNTPWKLYRDLLPIVYKRLAETLSVPVTWTECVAYGRSIADWPIFSDTIEALYYLKKHYKLVVLSNVDNQSFANTHQNIGINFDAIITAEDLGTYKPDLTNFRCMIDYIKTWGIAQNELLHIACSLYHDVKPAQECGLATCFINRRHALPGLGVMPDATVDVQADFAFTSLASLVDYHQRHGFQTRKL